MDSNKFADLGAEPIEDYSDLGATPADEATPPAAAKGPADFSDLGAEPVKDVNFFEGARDFMINMKSQVEQLMQRHQQEQAAQQAADNDPKNWSSTRFKKEAPKPQTTEEQIQYNAALQEKKDKEKAATEKATQTPQEIFDSISPEKFGEHIGKDIGVRMAQNPDEALKHAQETLNLIHSVDILKQPGMDISSLDPNTLRLQLVNSGIQQIIERPTAGLRAIAKETPIPEGFKKTVQTWVNGFLNPENYPPGTFAESLQKAGDQLSKDPKSPIWLKELADPTLAGVLGTIADAGAYMGVPESMGRLVTAGKVSILKAAIDELNIKGAPYGKTVKIPEEVYKATAANKDVFNVVDFYMKAKDLKVEIQPTIEGAVTTPKEKPVSIKLEPSAPAVPAEVIKDLGASPVEIPKFAVPEFKSSNDAFEFGRSVAGNPEAIKHLENARDELTPKIEELKTKTDTASFQEGYDLTVKRQFINEALKEAGVENPERTAPAPAAPESMIPKGKAIPDFTPIDKESIQNLIGEINDMEAAKRLPVETNTGEQKTIVTGYVPEYLQNIGVTKAKDIPLLEKAAAGEPVTAKQEERIRDLIGRHQEFMIKTHGDEARAYYAQKAEETNADAEREARALEGINSQLTEGEKEALGTGQVADEPRLFEEAKRKVLADASARGITPRHRKPLAGDVGDEDVKTQKELVAESVKDEPKSIKQVAEETKILEPNIRRILGVGTKEGTFSRVDEGVYILNKDGQDIAYIMAADSIETLPKLAEQGLKVDMVFLDIPYNTAAVKGGNRGVKYSLISTSQFRTVVKALSKIVKDDNAPVYYMYSQAPSGLKQMLAYNNVLISAGFKPIAEGEFTKTQIDGITQVRNMRGEPILPEKIMLLNKSGIFDEKEIARNLDFKLIRPKGYQTEKPAALIRSLIMQGTAKGETVLDPFAGSGVVPAEAVRAGRKAIAIEKNPEVVENLIKPRVEAAAKEVKTPSGFAESYPSSRQNERRMPLPEERALKIQKELSPYFGGLEYVRAFEMPELVRIAKEISGKTPQVVKATGTALGRFIGRPGEKGHIKLIAKLFEDPDLAAAVLAHEIGHNIDWLPDQNLKRGNLIGRAISSVTKFMKQTFGPDLFDPDAPNIELKAKELRKELIALTQFWKPFDDTVKGSYRSYRYSAPELYADFVSVLMNAPVKAQEIAPKFYEAFFAHLDNKPEVKQSFFALQDLLNDPVQVLKSREADIVNMFEKSRDQFENLLNQKIEAKKSLRFLIKYHFIDKNTAILDARNKVAAKTPINPEEDPKYLLEENSMIGAFIKSHLDDFDLIYKDLRASGLDFDKDFGQYLFLKRVSADRAEMANPLGHNPETAGRQLDAMKERLGPERFAELEGYVNRAREWFKSVNELLKEDILSEEQKKMVDENNDYAPFRVTKYLKEYASARFAHQVGTLNEIENPGSSMVLKGVAMLRLYKRNLIEKNTMKFLQNSGDAEAAQVKTFDGGIHIKEKEGVDIVKWREAGKWHAAYVDPFIADSFKYDDSGQLQTVGEVFNKILLNNQLFRPLYITFNVGFQSFNLIKDFTRAWTNTPGLTFPQAIKNYIKAFPHAVARVQEKLDPLVQQMEREGALNITMNDMIMGKDSDDTEIDALMSKYGLRTEAKKPNPLFYPLTKMMEAIKFSGDVIETIPKIAGFYALDDMPASERAYYIRNYVGTPNFKRKGKMFPIYNSVFMFSNIFKEGLRADFEVAFRNPKTRAGFWWKTIKKSILPKIIMALGLAGLFGKAIQDNYRKQTEYDKTNYITIPLGTDETGKAIYGRIPMDESSRLIGGLFWKTLSQKEFKDIFAFGGGQLPSLSPTLNIMTTWGEYLTGGNPKDNFRSQNILTDDEAKAGGVRSIEPMVRWTLNQSGMVHMDIRDRLKNETLLQKAVALTPIVNRFIRITDYGEVENLKTTLTKTQSQEANKRLDTKDLITKGIREGLKPGEAARAVPAQERKKFIQKYLKAQNKMTTDPTGQALGQAVSNEEKLQLLSRVGDRYETVAEYRKALIPYYKAKIISLPVLNGAVRQFNKEKQGAKK